MTALTGRTVKRTFSEVRGFWTGLPSANTHEAGGQDLGDLGEAIARVLVMKGPRRHARRVDQNEEMSSVHKRVAKAIERYRER